MMSLNPFNWYKNRTIKTKILLIALIGGVFFMIYQVFNYTVSLTNEKRLNQIKIVDFPTIDNISTVWIDLFTIRTSLSDAISQADPDFIIAADKRADKMRTTLTNVIEYNPARKDEVNTMIGQFNSYFSQAKSLSLGLIDDSISISDIQDRIKNMNTSYDKLAASINTFREDSIKHFSDTLAAADAEGKEAVAIGIIMGLCVLTILVSVGWFTAKRISRDVSSLVTSLDDMAAGKGDLTIRLKKDSNDEIGDLVDKFNSFVSHLQLMVRLLANLGNGVSAHSEEVKKIAEKTQHI